LLKTAFGLISKAALSTVWAAPGKGAAFCAFYLFIPTLFRCMNRRNFTGYFDKPRPRRNGVF
jgi:hypothetical protein